MKIIIFGAGIVAKRYVCEMNKEVEIVCFLDNNREKVGQDFFNKPIVCVEDVKKYKYDNILLTGKDYEAMEEKLVDIGVDYKKILYADEIYDYSYEEFMNLHLWKIYNDIYANHIIHKIVQKKYEQIRLYSSERLYATKYIFRLFTGKEYDCKLSTLNDKIRYLEMNVYGELEKLCTDKYLVRKYVQHLEMSEILPKLYFVKEKNEKIEWDLLPDKFVIKVNNGCGCNIICNDKKTLNYEYSIFKINRWLNKRHELLAFEWHYENIPPKIICEELLETDTGELPIDYKYFCCNGKIACILVCTERDHITGESFHYYFDSHWNQLDYAIGSVRQVPAKECCKPLNLDKMNEIAEKLASVFPFVRVDLYNINGIIYFGELTFSPCGGLITIQSDEAQKELGGKIDVNYKFGENRKMYRKLITK